MLDQPPKAERDPEKLLVNCSESNTQPQNPTKPMATISIAGTITGGKAKQAVSVKEFEGGAKLANFSVLDKQYFYSKEDRKGQFYNVQVRGKEAEIASDRLAIGNRVAVTGQLVQRDYNGKTYFDVINANITYLEGKPSPTEDSDF